MAWATHFGHMIGKASASSLQAVASWRRIIVGPTLQKWHLHCVFELVEPYMIEWPNFMMGFRPGYQPLMMIDALRMTVNKCAEWDRPLFVGQTPVAAAFESMDHGDVINFWRKSQLPVALIAAMYCKMIGTSIEVVIGGHKCEPD